jgi:hypothetical protein
MEWMRAQGSQVYRRNVGGMYDASGNFVRFAEKGAADSWGILPNGSHFECEYKRLGKRPTYDQVMWLIGTNGHGASVSFWVDNLDTLERVYAWVVSGGRIAFSAEQRRYRIKLFGKLQSVMGPNGDYDFER